MDAPLDFQGGVGSWGKGGFFFSPPKGARICCCCCCCFPSPSRWRIFFFWKLKKKRKNWSKGKLFFLFIYLFFPFNFIPWQGLNVFSFSFLFLFFCFLFFLPWHGEGIFFSFLETSHPRGKSNGASLTVIPKTHFTQNVTCSLFCESAAHISI